LWLHYFWVFVAEFGVVVVYAALYAGLWSRIRSNYYTPATRTHARQAARLMALYPAVYVCCTIPLASARMMSIAGQQPSYARLCLSGAMITSNGFLDVLVYSLTRRISLFSNEKAAEANGIETCTVPFFGNRNNPFGTVTVIEANKRPSTGNITPSPKKKMGFFHQRSVSGEQSRTDSQQSFSGSTDELVWPWGSPRNIVRTETTFQVTNEPLELRDFEAFRNAREVEQRVMLSRDTSHPSGRVSYEFETKPEGYDAP
jgi:hypothetical protein